METQQIEILVVTMLWWAFAAVHGIYDAKMYMLSVRQLDRIKLLMHWHPHTVATIMRCIVAVALIIPLAPNGLVAGLQLLSFALMFSFWHNGFYYQSHRWMGQTQYHFFYREPKSWNTGWRVKLFGRTIQPFEFSPWQRSLMFILGATITGYLIYLQ